MARLTVTQAGKTRRFQLRPGTLTVGSADSATLTLADDHLAPLHLTLEVGADKVLVHVTQGVQAPDLDGASMPGTVEWSLGSRIEIGSVVLGLEPDESEANAAAPTKRPSPVKKGTAASSAASSRGASRGKSTARPTKGRGATPSASGSGRVQRRARSTPKKGLPTWAVLGIFAVGIIVVLQLLGNFADSSHEEAFDAETSLARIEEALAEGNVGKAESEMEKVSRHEATLSSAWRERFQGLRQQTQKLTATSKRSLDFLAGSKYLDTQVRNYENNYLVRSPERARARIFVKRAKRFLADWPGHPNEEEVKNKLRRWEPVAELGQPANLQDVLWEAKTLTWAFPRDYQAAFILLEEFEKSASEEDKVILAGVLSTHRSEREDYFTERYEYAAHYWDQGDPSKAVEYLVQLITKIGDPAMAEKAARSLVGFEGQPSKDGRQVLSILENMRGYRNSRPADFERLKKNATMRAFFSEHGLL